MRACRDSRGPVGDDDDYAQAQDTAQAAEAQPEQVCIDDVCVDVPQDGGAVELPAGFANHEHPPETEPDYEPESDTAPEPGDETTTSAPEPETTTTSVPESDTEPEPETTTTPEPVPEPEDETTTTTAPEPPTTTIASLPEPGESISLVVPMDAEPQNEDGTWPPRGFERVELQVGETIHLVDDPDSLGNPMERPYSPEQPCVYPSGCFEPVHLQVGTVLVAPRFPDKPAIVVKIEDWIVLHEIWVCWARGDGSYRLIRWTATPGNEVFLEGIYRIREQSGGLPPAMLTRRGRWRLIAAAMLMLLPVLSPDASLADHDRPGGTWEPDTARLTQVVVEI